MKAVDNPRIVVALGHSSAELKTILQRLGLAPLDDDSGDATLWLPAEVPQPTRQLELLFSITEAAKALGIARPVVYEMIARRELKVVDVGGAARVVMGPYQACADDDHPAPQRH